MSAKRNRSNGKMSDEIIQEQDVPIEEEIYQEPDELEEDEGILVED